MKSHDGVLTVHQNTRPFQFIESFQNRYEIEHLPELPSSMADWLGILATMQSDMSRRGLKNPPRSHWHTRYSLMVSEDIVVFDNVDNKIQYIKLVDPDIDNSIIDTKKN